MNIGWHQCPEVPGFFRSQMTVAKRIQEQREKRGWSQEELATRAGISLQSVIKHEAGRKAPQSKILTAYANAFGMPLKRFMSLTDQWKDFEYGQ